MGVRLSDMKARVRETTVKWDGDEIAFAYRPNEFTMELADQINDAAQAESLSAVTALMEPLLVWWDVLDDQDERIPAKAENMSRFPLGFLVKITTAITEDQDPESKG